MTKLQEAECTIRTLRNELEQTKAALASNRAEVSKLQQALSQARDSEAAWRRDAGEWKARCDKLIDAMSRR